MAIFERYLYKELVLVFLVAVLGFGTFIVAVDWFGHVARFSKYNLGAEWIFSFFQYLNFRISVLMIELKPFVLEEKTKILVDGKLKNLFFYRN